MGLASKRVRGLDGFGALEQMRGSIESIFFGLGFEPSALIPSANKTDGNAKIDRRFTPAPPVNIDAELDEALRDLVRYGDVICAAARNEPSRRKAKRGQK